jgi:hypothetical protein
LVSDYAATQGAGVTRLGYGIWRGIEWKNEGGVHTQIVRYDAESQRLLEARIWAERRSAEQRAFVERLLAEVRCAEPAAKCRHWEAFGVRSVVPAGFELAGSVVQPASVCLRFEATAERGGARPAAAEVWRLGMARAWFDGDLERLLRARLPQVTFEQSTVVEYRGARARLMEGWEESPRFERWLGRARRLRTLAWAAPDEIVVYVTIIKSPKAVVSEPSAFELGGSAA